MASDSLQIFVNGQFELAGVKTLLINVLPENTLGELKQKVISD
jgi:hypothetical protein